MQLSLERMARAVGTSEGEVLGMVRHGLPLLRLDGRYRCNRVELLEWALSREPRLAATLAPLAAPDAEKAPPARLDDGLRAGSIRHEGERGSLSRLLIDALPPDPGAALLASLVDRDQHRLWTRLGDDVTIPHLRRPILLRLPRPQVFVWSWARTALAFGVVGPEFHTHLQLICRIIFALGQTSFRDALLEERPTRDVVAEAGRLDDEFTRRWLEAA